VTVTLPDDRTSTALSTAPADKPESPPRRRRVMPAAAVRAWRRLTSMRTALVLLLLLALAALPGSLLPQRPLNPIKVDTFRQAHPGLGRLPGLQQAGGRAARRVRRAHRLGTGPAGAGGRLGRAARRCAAPAAGR